MTSRWSRRVRVALLVLPVLACAPRPAVREAPAPSPAASRLPPVPPVDGPLAIRVVYPRENALIAARDSNFIFGAVGNGAATLTIDGRAVDVHPNGAFIAFLPVPDGDSARYELVAILGADTARSTLPIRRLPPRVAFDSIGGPIVDSASLTPAEYTLRPSSELVRVGIRAAPDASVWIETDSSTRLALSAGAPPDLGPAQRRSGGNGVADPRYPGGDPTRYAVEVPAGTFRSPVQVVVARGADTVRLPVATIDPYDGPAPWAVLGADSTAVSDTDRVVVGRPNVAGTYGWFLLPGTVVPMTGASGDFVRVRLDRQLDIWVSGEDVRVPPAGLPPPRRTVGAIEVRPTAGWVDIVVPTGERPPFLVEERGEALIVTLYSTVVSPSLIRFLENDPLVRNIVWEQETSDRARLHIHLAEPPFGYLPLWRADGGAFVLRVRRRPPIDAGDPLRGLTIAVDAGHPPAGATGPTGLYEGDAVLPVAERVRDLLTARGAMVVMTRTTPGPVALAERPIAARRADAHALVSVHLNALPDGVNPFSANGTSVLFFHPHSEPLARAVQRRLVERFGIRDLGVHYQNIALGRPTWMPAILTEGLFLMMPEQEAAIRTAEGQNAYARAIVQGLADYFAALAARR